jgi:hypothetical protein
VVSVTNTGTGDNVLATSPTITTPRVVTSLNDTNGNEVFGITATGSAVNELTIANAATAANPVISATGSDTNIGITLTPKGTGNAVLTSGNLVVANGNGIDFSATPGTGTSELLADYEEGTFTPVASALSGSITSYTSSGTYSKVGRLVNVTIACTITNAGTATGPLGLTLPFSGIATINQQGAGRDDTSGNMLQGRIVPTLQDKVFLNLCDNTGPIVTGADLLFTITYAV